MHDINLSHNQEKIQGIVRHYNHKRYWRVRELLINRRIKCKLINYLLLFYIKRSDSFNCASLGTHIGFGAVFDGVPELPHGISGIYISHNARIGKNARIYHQVTIGEGNGGAPTIGDNCFIGAGAKIIGNITIGNNVRIGSNCVVAESIPDNCTVVLDKPRVIHKDHIYE